MYSTLLKDQLIGACRERHLGTGGNKADLVGRLVQADLIKLSGKEPVRDFIAEYPHAVKSWSIAFGVLTVKFADAATHVEPVTTVVEEAASSEASVVEASSSSSVAVVPVLVPV
jgi:hypothetical protein